jgi:hypothetical protein
MTIIAITSTNATAVVTGNPNSSQPPLDHHKYCHFYQQELLK